MRRSRTTTFEAADSGRPRLAYTAGLLAVLALYAAHAWYFRHYINDDAFITFRYSRFVALGRGPYFNAGEHVEGYSNPLLMLLLVPVIAWGGADAALPVAKSIGVLSGTASIVCAFTFTALLVPTLGIRVQPWVGASLAGGLIAVSPSFAINSMSGLETTLFGFFVMLGVLLGTLSANDGRWRGSGAAFAAATLTRPEGALIFAVYWVAQLVSALLRRSFRVVRLHLLLDGATVAGVFLTHVGFRYLTYDGEWLPNTYFAKAGGFWAVDAWDYIRAGIVTPLGGIVAVAVATLAAIVRRAWTWMLPLLAVALAGTLLPFVTGTDWMPGERLLVPFIPLAAVIVALGWVRIATAIVAKPAWLTAVAVLSIVPIMWYAQRDHRRALFDESSMRARGYRDAHVALANWLCMDVARRGDAIALMDIGIIGYRCIDQVIVDITGLTDRLIARSPGTFLDKRYDPAYIFDRKPRFIVIVIKQPGDPNGLPSNAGFATWTNIERSLVRHPEFNRWYRTPVSENARDASWQAGLAANFGAVRLFQHAHPGMFYLLTVFERQEIPAS